MLLISGLVISAVSAFRRFLGSDHEEPKPFLPSSGGCFSSWAFNSVPHRSRHFDPRIADITSTGKLRVGIGLANLVSGVKDPATGELRGVAVDLGRTLAARIKVEFHPIEYPRPGLVLGGAKNDAWDVAFLVVDPERGSDADFSASYIGPRRAPKRLAFPYALDL
jgi:ABC-type amino acid transport substrate-binding protein